MIERAAVRHGRQTIRQGSKSFAAAARLFAPAMRDDAVMLYAWCRHCDDVIDGQQFGFAADAPDPSDAERRLARLRTETEAALRGRATDPVFAAFGDVLQRHQVPSRYPLEHLDGYAMDVAGRRYDTLEDTLDYCYGVAGTVGLMMAFIMDVRDQEVLERACDLGLAFQLTNIARDIVEDAAAGRVYVPELWLEEEGLSSATLAEPAHRKALARVAKRLVGAAEPFYRAAAIGVRALPFRAAWAVATALRVYRAIGLEVVRRGPAAWDERVATSTMAKLGHVAAAGAFGCGTLVNAGTRPRSAAP